MFLLKNIIKQQIPYYYNYYLHFAILHNFSDLLGSNIIHILLSDKMVNYFNFSSYKINFFTWEKIKI